MKAIRIVLFVLVVAAAGFLAFRGCGGTKPEPAPAPAPAPAQEANGAGQPAFPQAGPERAPDPKPPDKPKVEANAPDVVDPSPGTPVAAGASADVVVPYRAGTKSRYRISDGMKAQDLSTDGVVWREFEWIVSTEVVQGDGTGPARVRVTIDDFTFKTQTPNFPVMFRAKEPMTALLENEEFARTLRPLMATLGVPVEFSVGAGGAVTSVEGVDGLSRKFLETIEQIDPKYLKDTPDVPTAEGLTHSWTEFLFPPIGGGTLAAGATRDAKLHLIYFDRWDCVSAGKFRLTHSDESGFRVEFKGKPEIEEVAGAAKNESAAGIEKVRVASSADSYVGAWRFDRTLGRLVRGSVHVKYRVDVSRRTGAQGNGQPAFDARFTNVERRIVTELLDQ